MKLSVGLFVLIGLSAAVPEQAASLRVEAGNVFLESNGRRTQLTSSGRDSQPALSPEGAAVVFVRATPTVTIEAGAGREEAREIWLVDSSGRNARRLVCGQTDPDPKRVLAGLAAPVFGPDARTVYFLSTAWVTSNAIHRVEVATGRVEFVAAGNSLEIVRAGNYAGSLIVQQHRYWLAGGSYDWYWLLDATGKEIGPVGEEDGLGRFREIFAK